LFALVAIKNPERDGDVNSYERSQRRISRETPADNRIGRPISYGEAIIGLSLIHSLRGCSQVRPVFQGSLAAFIQRIDDLRKIEPPFNIELIHRSSRVQQLSKLYFGRSEVDPCTLKVGLKLYSLKFDPIEIHTGDVTNPIAVVAELKDPIVKSEAIARNGKSGLILHYENEGVSQVKKKVSFLVLQRGSCDGCSGPRALTPKLAFVAPLDQIRTGYKREGVREGPVNRFATQKIELIGRHCE